MIRHDLTRKLAFTSMKNLIGLLNEKPPAADFTPRPLDFAIQVSAAPGFDRTQYVHHLLLQKSNGTHSLLIWHEIALDDTSVRPFRRVSQAPPMPVTLRFSAPVIKAAVYDPLKSDRPARTFERVDYLALDVPDRVIVVSIGTSAEAQVKH